MQLLSFLMSIKGKWVLNYIDKDGTIYCEKCERKVYNKEFLTARGCRWCDEEYALKKLDN